MTLPIHRPKPPTWLERWIGAGGAPRTLGARQSAQAQAWADKNGFTLRLHPNGRYTLSKTLSEGLGINLGVDTERVD